MLVRKMIFIPAIMIITLVCAQVYAESSQKDHLITYQKAVCSDKVVRYCVKAKATGNLWWLAFNPAEALPVGAENSGNAKCDKARVGSNLKGAFTATPTIKCFIDEENLI